MRRRLLFLNVLLIGLLWGAISLLKQRAAQAQEHERQVLQQKVKPAPAPVVAPLPSVPPTKLDGYIGVAQKPLFSRDRDPNPIIEPVKPPPPKVMPPLPFAYGVIDFGGGPTVIMAEKAGAQHHGYHPGDKIGAFKLVSVNNRELVLDWDGQKIPKKLEELVDKSGQSAAAEEKTSQVASAPKPPPPPTVLAPAEPKPGLAAGEMKLCQPGDTSPAGTVSDGFRKVYTASPFGQSCRWEPVK
jgi:hypothetical protein